MKKLSIVLAIIMALSCMSFTCFAADESSSSTEKAETTTAAPATMVVTAVITKIDNTNTETRTKEEYMDFTFKVPAGATMSASDIVAMIKARLDEDGKGNALFPESEYVISDVVMAKDDAIGPDGTDDNYAFKSQKAESGKQYHFWVFVAEIDDTKNLTLTVAEQLAIQDWGGVAKSNTTLINQIINGFKSAIESLAKADWSVPAADKKEDSAADNAANDSAADDAAANGAADDSADDAAVAETDTVTETPDTGVSAVAGAAVVVLALSATTAVVLRKKED